MRSTTRCSLFCLCSWLHEIHNFSSHLIQKRLACVSFARSIPLQLSHRCISSSFSLEEFQTLSVTSAQYVSMMCFTFPMLNESLATLLNLYHTSNFKIGTQGSN